MTARRATLLGYLEKVFDLPLLSLSGACFGRLIFLLENLFKASNHHLVELFFYLGPLCSFGVLEVWSELYGNKLRLLKCKYFFISFHSPPLWSSIPFFILGSRIA
ncbi:hypothetical protein Zm00014a_040834 [Zea mays]|jgi:hypothetical protein|uniref:Uncharacterized protein n=1 Tax=Zea mays TaxID=4577 RepID=A0A317YKQ2_MAIZE|nr:hypothetical protein Zm00014a_040834 [Zea mays]